DIVQRIKDISGKGKRVTDADLYEIADSVMGRVMDHKIVDLEGIAVMTGNHVIPTATIKAKVNGSEHVFSSVGNGPIDAAMKAILGILPMHLQLKEFNIEAISGGTDAIGHVSIAVEDEHGRIVGSSASGDDVVLASVEAMLNAINLLYRT
ncbi:MAG TPA: alpha-isopropylmalate synthase regulatory domain-containing protein, partial [Methanomicrobiales archaeon]|nr:alpha-isopropylmalate synthase regulatory domain-containing protein [Methanomicrobiales archaeon]